MKFLTGKDYTQFGYTFLVYGDDTIGFFAQWLGGWYTAKRTPTAFAITGRAHDVPPTIRAAVRQKRRNHG